MRLQLGKVHVGKRHRLIALDIDHRARGRVVNLVQQLRCRRDEIVIDRQDVAVDVEVLDLDRAEAGIEHEGVSARAPGEAAAGARDENVVAGTTGERLLRAG